MLNSEIEVVEEKIENNISLVPATSSGISGRNIIMRNLKSKANE